MNSPSIYFDEDTHALFIQWRNRGTYQRVTVDGSLSQNGPWIDEVNRLPAHALELNTSDSWQEAFNCGRDEGFDLGFEQGYDAGYQDGHSDASDEGDWV